MTKIATTSVVCNIWLQRWVFRYGLCYNGIRLWRSCTQGTKARWHGYQFGD